MVLIVNPDFVMLKMKQLIGSHIEWIPNGDKKEFVNSYSVPTGKHYYIPYVYYWHESCSVPLLKA